ncbi:MAG: hypothetical protein Q8P41_29575 [Pseudomonadota bacterium]|nr:hypothetical protein [Pseudomonadota bacterium]
MTWLLAILACAEPKPADPREVVCPPGAAKVEEVTRVWCEVEDEHTGRATKHGPFVELDGDGNIEVRRTYADGKLDGLETRYYPRGHVAVQGSYAAGEREGVWEWRQKDGAPRLRGAYEAGKPVGVWQGWHENDQLEFTGTIDATAKRRRNPSDHEPNGFDPGAWARWSDAGTLHMVGAQGAKGKVGLWSEWDEDGPPRSVAFFVDNEEEGPAFKFWKSGGLQSAGSYRAGKKHGHWQEWSADGELKADETYVMGELGDGVHRQWGRDGVLSQVQTCADGRCKSETFHADGTVQEVGELIGQRRTGVWKQFCKDGSLEESQQFVDGRAEGPGEKWTCSRRPSRTTGEKRPSRTVPPKK